METTYRLTQTGKEVQDLLDQVTLNEQAIAAETSRAESAEQTLQGNIDAEASARQSADTTLQQNINTEEAARIAADNTLHGEVVAETSRATAAEQANASAISDEETRARAAEQANADDIAAIDAKIPAEASAQNQLADKSFVNSSVATNTATFRGSYNLVLDLHLPVDATRAQVITELNSTVQNTDNNDYCFVQIPVDAEHALLIEAVDRYKFDGHTWAFEYALNNSGFTQAQWAALNSGITSGLVSKLNALPTNADLVNLLAGKQNVLTFDNSPTAGSNNPVTSAGIKSAIDAISGGSSAALEAEIARAEAAEQTLQDNIDAETSARQSADTTLQDNIGAEETRARAAEQANASDIDAIEAKIPAEASAQNQLADKSFVNSSVATNTATFRGNYNLVNDLHLTVDATRAQIASALSGAIATADNNDYCFVQIPVADATPTVIARVERYKFNGQSWTFEYDLNNSGFTQAQWDAINSTITSGLVAKLSALPTNADLTTLLSGKQDVINDLQTIREGAASGATAYQKPVNGIPSTDMSAAVQTSLEKADTALQEHQSLTNYYTKSEVDSEIDAEELARQQADTALDSKIDDNTAAIAAEETRAKAAEKANADDIDAIEAKIPSAASDQNQLADKAFVNNSVATATATYRGAYNLVSDLSLTIASTQAQIATALAGAIATADNNDYCFVQIPVANATPTIIGRVDRYKFNGTEWAFEYSLNNSGFTAAQWDSINSGIASGDVSKIAALPTNSELTTLLSGKQDVISDLATIRSGAAAGAASAPQSTTYTKNEVDALVGANATDIDAIEEKIPSTATSSNQLADKAFVNNSVATATATYRGAYNLVSDLSLTIAATQAQIATALAGSIATADNNDYCFVQIPVADATPTVIARVDRYKFNGTDWAFEYSLNNSGFTAAQWAALNSGITSGLVTKLSALPAITELQNMFAAKQNVLTFDTTPTTGSTNPVTSGGIKGAIDTAVGNEETRARAAEQVNALAIDDVEAMIPTQASASNQLADKAFVNSAIATNTGDFVGTFNSLAELQAVQNPHNNDYGYVISTDQQGNQSYSRYKYNGTVWEFEYSLNNSSFTTEEWAAIQSGITSALVTKLSDLYTKSQLDVILDSKQSALTFDNTPIQGSENPVTSGGIYNAMQNKADKVNGGVNNNFAALDSNGNLKDSGKKASDFQDALVSGTNIKTINNESILGTGNITVISDISGKADKVSNAVTGDFAGLDANGNLTDSGKKASDFATAAQGAKADSAYQKPSGGIPDTDLSSTVQTSLGKADTALQSQEQADWNETDTDDPAYIKNKPTIPVITGKADKVDGATSGDFAGLDANGNLTDSGSKASDFATAAQGAKADSAYQKPSGGIPDTDLSSAVQTSLGKADTALQSQVNADWNASSGAAKILNKPTIPAAQIQSDWNQTNTSAKDYIKNKPTIPSKMSDVADISVVAISADTSSSCSITGAGNAGKSQTIIYTNNSGSDKVVTVPTTYATPDGAAIELTVVSGGYCEVNYLNVGGTIYARGL